MPPRVTSRRVSVGPHGAPKRIALADLEKLAREIRTAADAVADDLGIAKDARTPVELVEFLEGSSVLGLEQASTIELSPLALAVDASALRGQGRALPPMLTERGIGAIEHLTSVFAAFAVEGKPIRVTTPAFDRTAKAISPPPRIEPEAGTEELKPNGDETENLVEVEIPAVLPAAQEVVGLPIVEPRSWLVQQSGTIERLDAKERKLWLRMSQGLVGVTLQPEQFDLADDDDARWKSVLVTAWSKAPALTADAEVRELEAYDGKEEISDAQPLTTLAGEYHLVLERLEEFGAYTARWDSYDAKAIPKRVIGLTSRFIHAIARRGLPPPFITPIARGAVQLEWEKPRVYLELEVYGAQQINAARVLEENEETIEGPVSWRQAIDLVGWFSQRGEKNDVE